LVVDAFGEVGVEGGDLTGGYPVLELGQLLGRFLERVDRRPGLVLAEDPQVDISDERFVLARVHRARALDGGDTADECSSFGVACEIAE
jgi:hypothetical protein